MKQMLLAPSFFIRDPHVSCAVSCEQWQQRKFKLIVFCIFALLLEALFLPFLFLRKE